MVRAVFPGTFDPIHYGHIDIARRAVRLFDELIVAVYDRPLKSLLFTPKERLKLVEEAFQNDERIKTMLFSGLIVNFCQNVGSQVIVRGLRVFSDFEHEFRMALANHRLNPKIDVIALITSEEHSFLTGSTVKEIALLNGDVSTLVPPHVEKALNKRFSELSDEARGGLPMNSLRD
jgi:pantetheine-phosphate adenylyltransferase